MYFQKKRNSDRDLWRNSWGSAHSAHSSCSIHSSATMASVLAGHGKDDFWAALQTNYNYIMDTNLLDSCKEARGELLEGNGGAGNGCFAASGRRGDEEYKDDDDDSDGAAKVSISYSIIEIAL